MSIFGLSTSSKAMIMKYMSFVGPGLMISVAYMDPGNYSTAVSSGAMYEYKLLFIVFLSNLFAVVLQCLCIKLGSVSGLDLAEFCRLHLPSWLNLFLYACAEVAIVATDLAEVVGTTIALEILFGIPLVIGVFITVLDVLVVLAAYHKDGSMRQTRLFELLVSILVFATCICFVLELFKCDFRPGSFGAIMKGFLPVHKEVFKEKDAFFLSCGIVGSTVMPHSLYLGSALVQSRLKDYDVKHGFVDQKFIEEDGEYQADQEDSRDKRHYGLSDNSKLKRKYKPSCEAIEYSLNYAYIELVLSLFIIAVFVNAAILIVSGNTLYKKPDAEDADLLSIYEMLSYYINPTAGFIFALSMLFSGQSAGIVCTMAGQIVSEGFINWSVKPWIRRIITRVVAIIPVLIVIVILGREGVSKIINSSQVLLSLILPLVSAPLIWFTSKKHYMTVKHYLPSSSTENTTLLQSIESDQNNTTEEIRTYENGIFFTVAGIMTWAIISALNVYLIVAFMNGADI